MKAFLGIDTSNYTTSLALWQEKDGITQVKKLLPVKEGELGLRQSDAVFHHTRQLPELAEQLFSQLTEMPSAIGVSVRPRNIEGSYMPCFLAGMGLARSFSALLKVPLYTFSHQQGHIAAAIYSCNLAELFEKEFIAFHLSGGTTEALLVTPREEDCLHAEMVAQSLDLKAGQAIDRVGNLLKLPFPSGKYMDALSLQCKHPRKVHGVMKGADCCLSGIENQCKKLLEQGAERSEIARYCIDSVAWALEGMTDALLARYGNLPLLYAGGVMSNTLIREKFTAKYHAHFAAPEFSADNAAGIAYLTQRSWMKEHNG